MDEVEGLGEGPGEFDVVNFELDVGGDPVWWVRFSLGGLFDWGEWGRDGMG